MKGYITKRSKVSYSISIYLGKDENGKKKYKWYTVKGTKKEAEKFMNQKIMELENGCLISNDKVTVNEFLEYWYNEYCLTHLEKSTYESYKRNIDKHIVPYIGKKYVSNLKPLDIQKMYNQLLEKLSKKSVLYIHRILHKALSQAVKWEFVARNIIDAVEAPKPETYQATVLTPNQVTLLLSGLKNTDIYIPVLIAIATGLRRGEILALTWNDIDFENRTLTVNKSIVPTQNELTLKQPKTQKSNRKISISETLVIELQEFKHNQEIQSKFLKEKYQNNNLIVCDYYGNYYSPTKLNHLLKKYLQQLELPSIRFHDLRHTHASILLNDNVNIKCISDRLGHSTVGITLNTYSHVFDMTNEELATNFDKFLKTS